MSIILQFWPQILAALAIIAGALGIYGEGRKDANTKHTARKAKTDAKAHDRIDGVTPVDPNNRADIVDRLRRHSE